MKAKCLIAFFIFAALSLSGQTKSGSALLTVRFVRNGVQDEKPPNQLPDRKFWLLDSIIIAEGRTTYFNDTPTNRIRVINVRVVTDKYFLIDLRKKWYYLYQTFSDTAAIVKKYAHPLKGEAEGGFKFLSKAIVISRDSLRTLPDTSIEGVIYKRTRSVRITHTDTGNVKSIHIGYQDCNKKGSPLVIDIPLSSQMACPYVREDILDEKSGDGISVRFLFLTPKLTSEELKVFAAWKKNEKRHPVTNQ